MNARTKQVVVISGPSGSGESTITEELCKRFSNVKRLVTSTTRPRRSGEAPDHYFFFTKEEFLAKASRGEILEVNHQANRDVYYGMYAPALTKMLEAGLVVVVNSDIVGTRYCKEHFDAVTIFIQTPTVDDLIARIRVRNPDMSEHELNKRRESAENEIDNEKPFYDYSVTNENGKLSEALDEIVSILTNEGYQLQA